MVGRTLNADPQSPSRFGPAYPSESDLSAPTASHSGGCHWRRFRRAFAYGL